MSENKKIAKNTILLYGRLIVTTIIGLYTSRLVLRELGAEDFGLYTVVGGVVSMLNFLNVTLVSTTNRFIAVELGKGEKGNPNKQFNLSLVLQIVMSIILVAFVLVFGIYYVKNHLNILPRQEANAIFVLLISAFTTMFAYISIPYQGLITALEKFNVRVGIEIFKSALKLGLVLMLVFYGGDKLRLYAIIMTIVIALPSLLYVIYCNLKYKEFVKWQFYSRINDYLEMVKYSGWVVLGVFASMGRNQGAAMVINFFFGTVLNASFGIATQVNGYIKMFVRNLSQAAVPQIMKSHSSGDEKRGMDLVYYISKYSFFMMYLLVAPIILSLNEILGFWLTDVPQYTYHFAVIMVASGLFSSMFTGFDAAIHATGNIKWSHVFYSVFLVLSIPIAIILYKLGAPPYTISIVAMGASILNQIAQTFIICKLTSFSFKSFFSKTVVRSFYLATSFLVLYLLRSLFGGDLISVVFFSLVAVLIISIWIGVVGLEKRERGFIMKKIKLVYNARY